MTHSKTYCKQIVELYKTGPVRGVEVHEELVATGKEFTKVDTVASKRLKKSYRCKTKECYYNAQKIVTLISEYDYYEGFATHIIPVDHAWLVEKKTGLVVDPTWEGLKKKGDYFGIPIPVSRITKTWLETELATQLLWEYLYEKIERRKDETLLGVRLSIEG